jgi:hypothetical protein
VRELVGMVLGCARQDGDVCDPWPAWLRGWHETRGGRGVCASAHTSRSGRPGLTIPRQRSKARRCLLSPPRTTLDAAARFFLGSCPTANTAPLLRPRLFWPPRPIATPPLLPRTPADEDQRRDDMDLKKITSNWRKEINQYGEKGNIFPCCRSDGRNCTKGKDGY